MAKTWGAPYAYCSDECEALKRHVGGPRVVELLCYGVAAHPCSATCGSRHGHREPEPGERMPTFGDLYIGEDDRGTFFRGLPEHQMCAICDERAWYWFKARTPVCVSCFDELSMIERRREIDREALEYLDYITRNTSWQDRVRIA